MLVAASCPGDEGAGSERVRVNVDRTAISELRIIIEDWPSGPGDVVDCTGDG